ncbi:hypothetical protein LSTR_LSTR008527 [Laodelphax striatellus]|uniref:Phosphatidylinositol-specific phospholipase C X domain-containing protein n=1 Tax=Laodelphax striatellus TaxID=195883 RepID=A0A482WSQ9_LAOST|nr:hypothetical protein LSTR_LSTR008527 [Laodelphax striatellus]
MLPVPQLIILIFFGIFTQCYACNNTTTADTNNCTSSTKLALTIEVYSRMLEVTWDSATLKNGDWIAVYDGSVPTWLSGQKGIYSFEVTNTTGRQVTPISADSNHSLSLDITVRQSLQYSACFWRKRSDNTDEAITTTRFYTFPNWQSNYWETIKNRSLTDIFIPGTANSACYTIQNPHSVINQLAMGIRYLDIRVSIHNLDLYAAYYDCCQTTLDTVIEELLYFISHSKKEVVILDITEIKLSSGKFQDNGIEALKNQTFFDKVISFFFGHKDDKKKPPPLTFDDYLLGYLNKSMRVNGTPVWIERKCEEDGKSIYNKTLQDISTNGSRIIISYPNSTYKGQFEDMVWDSYLKTFNWTITDLTEFFFRESAFPEFIRPNQLFEVDLDDDMRTSDIDNDTHSQTGPSEEAASLHDNPYGLQGSSTEFRHWGIDPTYNLAVNILLGQYFRNIGNVRTAFVWNERLTSQTGLCDPGPSTDSSTWYHQHSIVQ